MLKSTYRPAAPAVRVLPAGWTEHQAPTGQSYYFHAASNTSTYTRPTTEEAGRSPDATKLATPAVDLSDPRAANVFLSQQRRAEAAQERASNGDAAPRSRPQPTDKPQTLYAIPGCEPWQLVYTKLGRRFAYNPDKASSYWRIPDKLKEGVLELDQRRIRQKAGLPASPKTQPGNADGVAGETAAELKTASADEVAYDSDEYEEVEVTDDEDGGEQDADPHNAKRRRISQDEDEEENAPVEFSEADMAYQLQAMGAEYGLEAGEFDDGNMEEWPEGADGVVTSDEDAQVLFVTLLEDLHISPYSPWDKLIEEGRIIEDPRYTVLPTTKARKETWEAWTREKIRALQEERAAKKEAVDPLIPYLAFLQEKATAKLYWPEFRRRYKKEAPLKDTALADKDREKLYREYIARLKLSQAKLEDDLVVLLRATPLSELNKQSNIAQLPNHILTDLRYHGVSAASRDAIIQKHIESLADEPGGSSDATVLRPSKKQSTKHDMDMRDKDFAAAQAKRDQQRALHEGRARLRAEQERLKAAMIVDKRGLQSQLK